MTDIISKIRVIVKNSRPGGCLIMKLKNITLRSGGVVATKVISFDIRVGEIMANFVPNRAGKSSISTLPEAVK